MEQMDNQDAYRQACRRVDAKLGFYGHIGIYIAVNLLLVCDQFDYIAPLFLVHLAPARMGHRGHGPWGR